MMKRFIKNLSHFLSCQFKGVSGYSLTELSITTSIIAVMAVGGLSIMGKKNEADKVRLTTANLASIETALKSFIRTKGYLPCPALPGLAETNVNFGKSEGLTGLASPAIYSGNTTYNPTDKCSNNGLANETGAVPVRTLGISDSLAYDGWGRKFTFRTASASGSPVDFNYPNFKGNIGVVDLKGTHKTTINDAPPFNDGAIYVIISHGPNGENAAYRRNNTSPPDQSKVNGIEFKNTDHTRPLYIQNDRTNFFDDIVAFGTNSKLGRQKIAESPIRLPDIACQNAQFLARDVKDGTSDTAFTSYATASSNAYSTRAATILKSATILAHLCQNRKNSETIGPNRINGLQLWLDANDAGSLYTNNDCVTNNPTITNNDKVKCWKDKSGNRYNATQASPSNAPTYITNTLNGLPVLRFNGTSSTLSYPNIAEQGTTTIFTVYNKSSHSSDSNLIGRDDLSVAKAAYYIFHNGQVSLSVKSRTPPDAWSSYNTNSAYYISSTTDDNTNVASYVNGNLQSTIAIKPTPQNKLWGPGNIGSWAGLSNYHNGDIAEIIIYNRALTTAEERSKVEEYLSEKWGIPIDTATATKTCPKGLAFQKTSDDPQGSCKCADSAQSFATDLVTADACYAVPLNNYFGKCRTKATAPDYNTQSPDKDGMVLWLDANDCSTITLEPTILTATTVAKWADKSGLGHNASQSQTPFQPTYVKRSINNMPVIRFNGSNQYLSLPDPIIANGNKPYTVFMTMRPSLINNNGGILNLGNYGTDGQSLAFRFENNGAFDNYWWGGVGFDMLSPPGSFTINTNYIISVSYDTSTGRRIYRNGTLIKTDSSTSFSLYNNGLGTVGKTNGTEYLNGDIGEIIVYNTAFLTSKERMDVENYLSTKWDIIRYPDHSSLKPNLKLWLDANDAGTLYKDSGCTVAASTWDSVGCWGDKSTQAHNARQVNSPARPSYAQASINGLPALNFNGSNYLISNLATNITTSQITYFVVQKRTNTTPIATTLAGTSPSGYSDQNAESFLGTWEGDTTVVQAYRNTAALSGFPNPGNNIKFLVTGKFDGTNHTIYKDGLVQNVVASSGAFNISQFTVAAWLTNSAPLYDNLYNGNIAEIIVYQTALSDSQRLAIERYLGPKWGITVP